MTEGKTSNLVPIAILLAGLVLSGTIYAVRHVDTPDPKEGDVSLLLPIDESDHLMGDTDAKVTVVTYSDIDCEYCKRFHEVMEQLMADYGTDGNVAWVYRHFPIVDLHPYSGTHAKAAECAAALGTPELFWRFISAVQAKTVGAEPFNPQGYGDIATSLGLNAAEFSTCAASNRFEDRVARDFTNGLQIGAKGTPYTVVTAKGFEPVVISGYVPYDGMKTVVDGILAQMR